MARKRIMEYGPTVRTPRVGMQTVSVNSERARRGVFLRVPPGTVIGHGTTVKSKMGVRPHRGMRMPGIQAKDMTTPLS